MRDVESPENAKGHEHYYRSARREEVATEAHRQTDRSGSPDRGGSCESHHSRSAPRKHNYPSSKKSNSDSHGLNQLEWLDAQRRRDRISEHRRLSRHYEKTRGNTDHEKRSETRGF